MKQATIFDYARMCRKVASGCLYCPLSSSNNNTGVTCSVFIKKYPDKANEIILKWCEEHPIKTRQSEFLEMFPNVVLNDDEVISICPNIIDGQYGANCSKLTCKECRKEYCLAEVDE